MTPYIFDVAICSFCCVGFFVLVSGIMDLPLFSSNNQEIIIDITYYNKTLTPNELSFHMRMTNICPNNIRKWDKTNLECSDIVKCPPDMEIGKSYTLYCSCINLVCSFENTYIHSTNYETLIAGGIILSILIIYITCRLIYECCIKQ